MTISNNKGYGIAILGSAHDNDIFNSYIGTNYLGTGDLGNQLGGIYIGPGTSGESRSVAVFLLSEQDLQ